MDTRHHLEQNLRSLRMPGILDNLNTRLSEAREQDIGYLEFLSLLLQDERSQRDANQVKKLLRQAGFGAEKTFEGFDFRFNPTAFPQAQLRDLATCAFIDLGQNLVIAGPPGIGKTHVAKAIGHEACRRKRHVIYKNVYDIFGELSRARTDAHYERLLKRILKSDLLILDDFALRKFETKEVDMLYAIVDARDDAKSVILTSNRPPEDWLGVFPDPIVGGAILDRLVSGAIKIMVQTAKSYRKEGRENQTELDKKEKIVNTSKR